MCDTAIIIIVNDYYFREPCHEDCLLCSSIQTPDPKVQGPQCIHISGGTRERDLRRRLRRQRFFSRPGFGRGKRPENLRSTTSNLLEYSRDLSHRCNLLCLLCSGIEITNPKVAPQTSATTVRRLILPTYLFVFLLSVALSDDDQHREMHTQLLQVVIGRRKSPFCSSNKRKREDTLPE